MITVILLSIQLCSATVAAGFYDYPVEGDAIVHTAFVQTGDELHFFSETTKKEKEMFTGGGVREASEPVEERPHERRQLLVRPPVLDFGDTDFGEASIRYVEICNKRREEGASTSSPSDSSTTSSTDSSTSSTTIRMEEEGEEVRVDAILGDSPFVHSTFIKPNTLKKEECARLSLCFLSREMGLNGGPLMMHSSEGAVYSVHTMGRTRSNRYRVAPFVGSRIAINGTLSRSLVLHNPYEFPLRITDIASSGGGLFVQLPTRQDPDYPANQNIWDLNPFETRHVANLMLMGVKEGNSTAFALVRAELLREEGPQRLEPFFFSMPYQCVTSPGIFATTDILDFGLIPYGERSKQLMFSAYSTLGKFTEWEVKRVTMEPEESSAVYLEYPVYPPVAVQSYRVGVPGPITPIMKVQIDTSYYNMREQVQRYSGRLVIWGSLYNVSMAYTVAVFKGSLSIEGDDGCLHDSLPSNSRHSIRIRSRLPIPVAIYNVSLTPEAAQHFTIRLFSRSVSLAPGEVAPVFLLKYNRKAPVGYTTTVTLQTNVSTYTVPIHVYDGRVEVKLNSPSQKAFDFGLVEKNDSRVISFEVRNANPASISLLSLRLHYPEMTRLIYRGRMPIGRDEKELPQWRKGENIEIRQGMDFSISPQSIAYFDLLLRVLNENIVESDLEIRTEFETRMYPIHYQVARGRILPIPSGLKFGLTHPGKVAYRTLQVFNSFDEDMVITEMVSGPGEKGIAIDPTPIPEGSSPLLRSGRFSNIGKVLLMPPMDCPQDFCYLGLKVPTPVNLPPNLSESTLSDGQWFAHGLTLPTNLADIDSYLYKRARSRFDELVMRGRHVLNSSLVLHTTKAKHIKVPVSGELTWPRLLTKSSIHFPLTAVGNFTIVNLTLANPTSEPVIIQVIPLVIYPDAEALVEAFRPHLLSPLTSNVEMNETLMFSLRDTELFTLRSESPVPLLREELEKKIGMNVPRFTLSAILQPHMKLRLRFGFLPSDYTLRSSLLIIRNNLTMVEPVVVYGRGARIGMEVEKVKSRSKNPLYFEIRHDHLHDCNNPKRLMHRFMSTLTVRRPFTVTNTGEVPFTIVNISINNFACENRGFRVLNCDPFRLKPNESHILDIAHTPDFLSTTNEADLQLYMHMNGSAWVYPLAATIPPEMMHVCHAALPRPYFENKMYYLCMVALFFSLICVLACGYLEGDRAIICALRAHYGASTSVFDLNQTNEGEGEEERREGKEEGRGGRRNQERRDWGPMRPSALSVGMDAPVHKRIFIKMANGVLRCIEPIWTCLLFWRKEKGGEERGRKRKARVPPTNSAHAMEEKERLARVQRSLDENEGRGRKEKTRVEQRPIHVETRREEKEENDNEFENREETNTPIAPVREFSSGEERREKERREEERMEEERKKREKERRKEEEDRRAKKIKEEKAKRKEEEIAKKKREDERRKKEKDEEKKRIEEKKKKGESSGTDRRKEKKNGISGLSSHDEKEERKVEKKEEERKSEERREERSSSLLYDDRDDIPAGSEVESEAPDWDDVDVHNGNVDADLSAMVEMTARGFDSSEDSRGGLSQEEPLNDSWNKIHSAAIGSETTKVRREEERRRKEEEKRRMDEERRRREEEARKRWEEEERRRWEEAENRRRWEDEQMKKIIENELKFPTDLSFPDWASMGPDMHLLEFNSSAPRHTSSWPSPPPSDLPSPPPLSLPPGLPPPPLPSSSSLPPPLHPSSTPFGSLFSGEHFSAWTSDPSPSASGWDPLIGKAPEGKKKE